MTSSATVVVRLTSQTWHDIRELCAVAQRERRETSWRLLGRVTAEGYYVDTVIGPGKDIDAGPGHVRADAAWQQSELNRLMALCPTLEFLGEGHLHPPLLSRLSSTDLRTGAEMARDPGYCLHSRVLLMLAVPNTRGELDLHAWQLTATEERVQLQEQVVVVDQVVEVHCADGCDVTDGEAEPSARDISAELNGLAAACGMTIRSASVTADDAVTLCFTHGSADDRHCFSVRLPETFPGAPPEVVDARGNVRPSLLHWTANQPLLAYVLSSLPVSVLKRVRRNRANDEAGRIVKGPYSIRSRSSKCRKDFK